MKNLRFLLNVFLEKQKKKNKIKNALNVTKTKC